MMEKNVRLFVWVFGWTGVTTLHYLSGEFYLFLH